jgi:hypothetical protein
MKQKIKAFLIRLNMGPRVQGEKIDLSYPPKKIYATTVQETDPPEFNQFWLQLWLRKA